MSKIKIDEGELLMLLEDHSGFQTGYVDRETGEIIVVFEDDPEGENEQIEERIEGEPGRYLYIDPIDSHEGFRIMEDFVDTLPDSGDKQTLIRALLWRKPFSNFKAALSEMPEIRNEWFEFHDRALRQYAKEWLAGEGIDAELVGPPQIDRE